MRRGSLPFAAAGSYVAVERIPGGMLQVGCGRSPIAGWINTDLKLLPGVDRLLDVRDGLPFAELACVFAEHFLEHLAIDEALRFLDAAREALGPSGRIRLSTPNLDWVWATHDPRSESVATSQRRTLIANRAFYGWEHRFLWSRDLLEGALEACGFRDVCFFAYGESDTAALRGLERHDRYADDSTLPHVLIAEGERGDLDRRRRSAFDALVQEEFLGHLRA